MKKENIIVELYKTDDEGGFEFTQYYENEQPIGIVDGDVLVQRYRFLAKDWTWNEDEKAWHMPRLGDVFSESLEEVVHEDLEGMLERMLESLKIPTLDSVLEYMDEMVEAEYYEKVGKELGEEYSYEDVLPTFKAMFFAKTDEEAKQIEADFLKGKDDEFIEYFQAEKHSFQNDYRNEIEEHEIAQQQ